MDPLQILVFFAGVGLLIGGAWVLIGGGTRAAVVLGVPPVVVGLTVVAFGTSAPELFVSLIGALRGNTALVFGNVIGSNVANVGLILALAAVLRPVIVEAALVRREVPYMLGASVFTAALAWDGVLARLDAAMLLVGFVLFFVMVLRGREPAAAVRVGDLPEVDPSHRGREIGLGMLMVAGGVAGLAAGGQLIITSAVHLAAGLGVSESLIGLTMVAVGTSLPELATTVVAALRNQDDMALGNIVGSNLFNLLGVAAPVALLRPLVGPGGGGSGWTGLQVQLASMLAITLAVFLMVRFGGGRIGRGRGFSLLALYGAIMYIWTNLE